MANYLDKSGLLRVMQGLKNQIERKVGEFEATKGMPNGIASLDNKGFLPIAQLGNLDTTFFEAVQELPTNNIKKHIYLIENTKEGEQNTYDEYIYTGDIDGEYDASKWEKLGDFVPTFDLNEYAKKSETTSPPSFRFKRINEGGELALLYTDATGKEFQVKVPRVNSGNENDGLMTALDKYNLDKINCWGDQISSTKGKDIILKTSSNNSVRLTEGEGFKVFANLFADPDHATDITEFTDEEKAMLKNNSVQRLLIMILKKLNLIDVIDPNT